MLAPVKFLLLLHVNAVTSNLFRPYIEKTMANSLSALLRVPSFFLAATLTILSGFLFTASHGIIRHIGGFEVELHPFEIAFFSNLFSALFYIPLFIRSGVQILHTNKLSVHILRSFFNAGSLTTFYIALTLTPLADVTALALAGPLFVTLGALLFLGEIIRVRRWIALSFGALGALIIIRPGFEEISVGLLFVILSSIIAAGSKLLAKHLAHSDSAVTCSAYVAILQTPITFICSLFVWVTPSLEQLTWLAAIGVLVAVAHICMVQAYKFADVSAMEPFVFLRLIWAASIGLIAFGEFPGVWTWVGGAIIVAASSYIAQREAKSTKHHRS